MGSPVGWVIFCGARLLALVIGAGGGDDDVQLKPVCKTLPLSSAQ